MKKYIWINIGIFFFLLVIIFWIYNSIIWKGVEPEEGKSDLSAAATQNTISTGVTAVSILLPLSVGILGLKLKKHKYGTAALLSACLAFTISLTIAIYNLNRIPGIVNVYNLANEKQTVLLMLIQLFSLLYGIICLTVGAFRIIVNLDSGGDTGE